MSVEFNKVLVRRFYEEVFNKRNLAEVGVLVHPDYVNHSAYFKEERGPESVGRVVVTIHNAFPDLHITVQILIAEGDLVAAITTEKGTHRGELWDIPATGKQITTTGIDIFRIAEGKLVERWGVYDRLGTLQQLGVIPSPGW